jgi:hypothetical protein
VAKKVLQASRVHAPPSQGILCDQFSHLALRLGGNAEMRRTHFPIAIDYRLFGSVNSRDKFLQRTAL